MPDQMIAAALTLSVAVIALMTPVIKLNTLVTQLKATMDALRDQIENNYESLAKRVTAHGEQIDKLKEIVIDGTRRIDYIEKKCDNCQYRNKEG